MTEALSSIASVTHFGRCTLSDLVRSPTFFGNRTLSGPITLVVPMDEPLASSLPVRDAGRCKLLDGQQTTHGPTVHNNRTNLTLCAKSWRPLSGLAQEGRRFSSPRNGSASKLAYAVSSPIRFPGSPEGWWGDEALQAEAQAPQAPREQRHQAAGNIPTLRSRGLFSAGVRFATASHMPVDTAQWRASDSTSTSRSSRSVRAM